MNEGMKFCRDCRFCGNPAHIDPACLHDNARLDDVVTGCLSHFRCGTMRLPVGECGPEAKLFEPKQEAA